MIRDFLPKAFRRPVDEEMQKLFVGRVHERLDKKDSFYDAMMYGYKSILSSPHFLLRRTERERQPQTRRLRTGGAALVLPLVRAAGRRVAGTGEEGGPEPSPPCLRQQVERMLKSLRASKLHGELCRAVARPAQDRRHDSRPATLRRLRRHTPLVDAARDERFLRREFSKNDLSLLEFVDSDWTMLNERLAKHYGVPGVSGNDFRKVKLPPVAATAAGY